MLKDLNKELTEILELRRRKDRLQRQFELARQQRRKESERLEAQEKQLRKERQDVERLEKLSLTGLFVTILGSKEEQLEKERQEALAASLKYQQSQDALRRIDDDIASLERDLQAVGDPDLRYESVLRQKENLLAQSGDARARRLLEIGEQLSGDQSQQREVAEAITAGKAALGDLRAVIDSLRSAEGWGTWDLLGGGLLATAAKHARIDYASGAVNAAQYSLQTFQRELADIGSQVGDLITISSFDTFADYFFDGLIVDWIVQSKIQESRSRAESMAQQVEQILSRLDSRSKDLEMQLASLNAEKQRILEEAA